MEDFIVVAEMLRKRKAEQRLLNRESTRPKSADTLSQRSSTTQASRRSSEHAEPPAPRVEEPTPPKTEVAASSAPAAKNTVQIRAIPLIFGTPAN